MKVRIKVNGVMREADVEPRLLLVHFLRDHLGLTGTHIGCDTTSCGACAVLLDGKAVKSCTIFTVMADGSSVTTIEGLGEPGKPHPIQEAFIRKNAFQCGYCTPGMIMAAYQLLTRIKRPSEEEIQEALSGNICRCTGYKSIVDAIKLASKNMYGK